MSRSNRPDPAPRFALLRHPLFLCALALLLVNDHALKGAGILPGFVTGKLSDFAGLIVAPVLAAALLGARSPRARALAFALVAVPFTAIKLSVFAADALVALASTFGLTWRIWQDPGDLVALLMLAPAWRLCAAAPLAAAPAPHRLHWLTERAALALSGVACVATSQSPTPGTYSTDAYLVNVAPRDVDVRVRWVDAEIDCGAIAGGDPTRMLGANAFNLGITYHLTPNQTLPLLRSAAYNAAGQGEGGAGGAGGAFDGPDISTPSCEVVLIETDGMAPVMAWWTNLPIIGITAYSTETPDFWQSTNLLPGRVILMPPALSTPGAVQQGTLQLNVAPSQCASEKQSSIQWTSPAPGLPAIGILEEVQEVPGGCVEITMAYPDQVNDPGTGGAGGSGGDPGTGGTGGAGTGGSGGAGGTTSSLPVEENRQTLYLCIPIEDFPFVMGDEIQILEEGTNLSIKDFVSTRRLELYRDFVSVSLGGLDALTTPGTCEGDRAPCGAYSAPAMLSVQTGGKSQLMSPGDVLQGPGFHVRLDRAEHIAVARDECGPGLDATGITADFLISWQ